MTKEDIARKISTLDSSLASLMDRVTSLRGNLDQQPIKSEVGFGDIVSEEERDYLTSILSQVETDDIKHEVTKIRLLIKLQAITYESA